MRPNTENTAIYYKLQGDEYKGTETCLLLWKSTVMLEELWTSQLSKLQLGNCWVAAGQQLFAFICEN